MVAKGTIRLTATLVALSSMAACFNPDARDTKHDTGPTDTDTDSDADADSDTDADTDSDTSHPAGKIEISEVDPSFGITTGGDQVTIRGGPFDDSAIVTFGGNAATRLSVTGSTLEVQTPSADAAAAVEVMVVTDDGVGALTDGFTYLADGQGKTGVFGSYNWTVFVGNYWKSRPSPYGSAVVTFIEPQVLDVLSIYGPSAETCQVNYSFPNNPGVWDINADSLQLVTPSGSEVTLPWVASDGYFERLYEGENSNTDDPLRADEFATDSSYDLDQVDCTLDFAVSDFIQTPDEFTITAPAITGNSPASLSQSQLTFRWNGTGADRMFLFFYMLNASGSDLEYVLYCSADDDGSFTVPTSAWKSWPAKRQMTVEVMRARVPTATLPFNNANIGIVGTYSQIGAFFTQ